MANIKNMEKYSTIIVLFFSVISFQSLAQESIISQNINDIMVLYDTQNPLHNVTSNIAGSPYLNEEWEKTTITLKDHQSIETYARFRYYDNTFEFKKLDQEKISTLNKEYVQYVKSIKLGNKKFIAINYTEKGQNKGDFFELLTAENSHLQLFKYYDKHISDAINNGYQDVPKTLSIRKKTYVYNTKSKKLTILKRMNKKAILSFFGEHAKAVEKYAKQNKLRFKKTKSLVNIFNYYNQIQN